MSERIYADAASTAPTSEKTTVYTSTGAVRSCTLDGSTATYTYDGAGNMLSETEGGTVKAYTYDDRGRKSGYTLYVNGEEKSSAVYEYDVLNRLISVTEGGKTTTYTYDANGNRASQTIGAVTTAYTYNKANLVTSITNTMENAAGEDTEISRFGYTYYMDGNIRTKTETLLGSTSSTAYTYDGAGRLRSETAEDGTISYTYDARGNRTHMNNAGTVTAYTYDANNRLLSETAGGETTAYTYDATGNTLSAGNKTYTYNARGQQTGYTDGTVTASYAYNPSGLRSAKTVGGATKYFVYNGMNIVYEYDAGGTEETVYYYGLNRTHNSDGEIYVYNAHGDVVQLVKNNAVTVSYTYDAFGNITGTVGESENAFLYCGEYYDAETETYYLRARYYNPANGRFTQQDAWGYMNTNDPLSLNLYTYCANNPIRYYDPDGTSIKDIFAGFIEALDQYLSGGLSKFIVEKIKGGDVEYDWDSEKDYHVGRVVGTGISTGVGAASAALGIVEIVGSVVVGGVITAASGGAAVAGGVAVSVEGVALGAAEVGYGVAAMYSAGSNFGNEWDDYRKAAKRNSNPMKNESEIWKNLDNVKGKNRKTSGTGNNQKYYEWDYTHNDIEVYDKKGNHLGSMDPTTGEMYKPAVPGRKIDV